jgi:AraC family transcriptional regulator
MEWLERLNKSVDYIEENLGDVISYKQAAQIACCSTYHYQRMFSYIAGIPLSE